MVSEKDLQSYLKVAASALPCREARKEFSSYVHNVAHDISIENPDTGSLDKKNRDIVMKLLHELNEEGKTVIIVTHDQSIIEDEPYVVKI